MKRSRGVNNNDDVNKKMKHASTHYNEQLFTREDVIKYRDTQSNKQRQELTKEMNNQTIQQLQQVAKNLGLKMSGTRSEIISQIVEYKVLRRQRTEKVNSERIEELIQFISQYETLKESELYPRDLATLTIHIPLNTFDGKDYSKDSVLSKKQYSFIKFYKKLKEIVSYENDSNIQNGDIIFIPPGIHTVGIYDIYYKSIEMIGMDNDNRKNLIKDVSSCQERSDILEECDDDRGAVLQIINSHSRFHNLSFTTGPVDNKVDSIFLFASSALLEVSKCRFERLFNPLYMKDTYLILHHCMFNQIASCAISLYEPQVIIIDQNEMTNCCLGADIVFGENIEVVSAEDDLLQKHAVGVIHCAERFKNLLLVMRGNSIHDNAGSEVTLKSDFYTPLLQKQKDNDQNVIVISDDNYYSLNSFKDNVNSIYICNYPVEKWERNQMCTTAVNTLEVSNVLNASDYQKAIQVSVKSRLSHLSQEKYLIYQVRSEENKNDSDQYYFPEDLNCLNMIADLPKVTEFDDCTLYFDSRYKYRGDGVEIFYIMLKKQIVVYASNNPLDRESSTKCSICNSILHNSHSELKKFCDRMIDDVLLKIEEYLETLRYESLDGGEIEWSNEDGFRICENGHIQVLMTID
jgi:hypothetical protein